MHKIFMINIKNRQCCSNIFIKPPKLVCSMLQDQLQRKLKAMEQECPSPSAQNPTLADKLHFIGRYISGAVEEVPAKGEKVAYDSSMKENALGIIASGLVLGPVGWFMSAKLVRDIYRMQH